MTELKNLKVNELDIVDYNPNEVSKSQMKHLIKTIKERGFMQPLTVTKLEGNEKYTVIDGAHRLTAMIELKKETVPCYVIEGKTETDIKIDLINLNKIKGEFDPDKFAYLLKTLQDDYNVDQLQELLNMSESELEQYNLLAKDDFDERDYDFAEIDKDKFKNLPVVIGYAKGKITAKTYEDFDKMYSRVKKKYKLALMDDFVKLMVKVMEERA